MPSEMKCGNRGWPSDSPISGERLSTPGECTRRHKGTVIQDSLYGADNGAYLRARETIRYGTLTPDAGDSNFPDRLITVGYTAVEVVKEISLSGVTYNTRDKVFESIPSRTRSFTFRGGETLKTVTNVDSTWFIT